MRIQVTRLALLADNEPRYLNPHPYTVHLLLISPQFLRTLAAQSDALNADRIELTNQYRFQDPKIPQIAQWLANEVGIVLSA